MLSASARHRTRVKRQAGICHHTRFAAAAYHTGTRRNCAALKPHSFRASDEVRSGRERPPPEPALGPAAVQTDILQQLAVQSVRYLRWRLSVQPPQRLVVRVAPELSVGGGQTDVMVGDLRVTEQPGQESRMDRHDVLHLLGVALT